MTYLNIIPLSEVRNHLRLDDDFQEDDLALERMITSALQLIEKRTNHIFLQSEKTYHRNGSGYVDIYDYPVSYVGDLTKLDYADKVRFDVDSVGVTVGYGSHEAVPSALIDAALMIIEQWYYAGESKTADYNLIPPGALSIINAYRRFTVC